MTFKVDAFGSEIQNQRLSVVPARLAGLFLRRVRNYRSWSSLSVTTFNVSLA